MYSCGMLSNAALSGGIPIGRLHLMLPLDDGGDDKFVKPIAQDPTKHGTDAVRASTPALQFTCQVSTICCVHAAVVTYVRTNRTKRVSHVRFVAFKTPHCRACQKLAHHIETLLKFDSTLALRLSLSQFGCLSTGSAGVRARLDPSAVRSGPGAAQARRDAPGERAAYPR